MALTPPTAQAAPFQGGNYGAYGFEGLYSTHARCAGSFRQTGPTRSAEGISLKYFYSDRCGSFARIENARQNCAAALERSNGRVSRALPACDGHALTSTAWY
ncbi:hypothetical protein E0500_037225 [Streptomyces sp. KM273126]|nr:hypothetical protein [Streptomyces sp. KM273126]